MQEFPPSKNEEDPSTEVESDEDMISEISVETLDDSPTLYEVILTLVSNQIICTECLGRQLSYLGTGTNNIQRATSILLGLTMECHRLLLKNTVDKRYTLFGRDPTKILEILSKNTNFPPPRILIQKIFNNQIKGITISPEFSDPESNSNKFQCYLCENILLPQGLEDICGQIMAETQEIEFNSFRIGTRIRPQIADREDELRARYSIRTGESFKANLNRLLGKALINRFNTPVNLEDPQLTILVALQKEGIKLEFQSKPIFIKGRYLKFVRTLPQTQWHCYTCRGKKVTRDGATCPDCKGSGRVYENSIQDYLTRFLLTYSGGISVLFHGAGREDLDVRCLGDGRPFIIEAKLPKSRSLDLKRLRKDINSTYGKEIHVSELHMASKTEVVQLKDASQYVRKKYFALVYLDQPISEEYFAGKIEQLRAVLLEKPVDQRTPLRVVHRRTDRSRAKKIYAVSGKYIDPVHIFLKLDTQGGTYIKELISGDNGRTNPSISSIFGIAAKCVELDVFHSPELSSP